ncbi:hypothetical protein [Accumulibacter sp.]|uniref:hypothetical protein n=1 Tax=Accumulibacter sp. TaxID=2053492 RepID=UPI0025D6B4E6|nr:hypothetical protein [Accumulibacter sp.]MCM8611263.1 hypothetical protein [Accumulibacter sp.]MCM8635324.1 hypothetical protein [Accumulibacter sp.]MCM8638745.1 hypothetical protein [Accumulibacter sp.]
MNLHIRSHDFVLTDGLRQPVATRLACTLNDGREFVTRVVARLADVLELTRGRTRRPA